ncbi:hypothetical protein OESDEN_24947 [Oesophagostomum dentatum]|uniref:Glycosyl-hydrolase family 116 catalytic region domain-containing protein n=1 Tax=Oesophagostomum dentatum TaxID=61180 RepID=A0A0B1RW85_OESDE|nr:hypothetical protein OESDEN_24947 [Oesophagostomum dentatum]
MDLIKQRKFFVTKLWNGRYFNFDETAARQRVIMADQLCGIWFLTLLQQDEVISDEQITTALQTIYDNNVQKFAHGNLGPVNGILENGTVDYSSMQSEEVWTGTAYSLASFMIAKGKWEEGFDTARGIVESCWQRMGFQYQTPEAIYEQKYYRAIGYMRPLAIWAIQHALEIQAAKKQ